MSRGLEKLLRRMILPNADLRCTAAQAMEDEYWVHKEAPAASHREWKWTGLLQKLIYATGKGASVSHAPSLSLGLDKDVFKFSDIISTWSPRSLAENDKEAEKNKEKEKEKESPKEKHKHDHPKKRGANKENDKAKRAHQEETPKPERRTSKSGHARSQSQPKLMAAEGERTSIAPSPTSLTSPSVARVASQTKKNAPMPSLLGTLSPIRDTPPPTPSVFSPPPPTGKENVSPAPSGHSKAARTTRKPLGPRGPTPPTSPTSSLSPLSPSGKENAPAKKDKDARRSRVFKDVTAANRNVENTKPKSMAGTEAVTPQRPAKSPESRSNSVRDRMKAWERERVRLREMEMLEERVREVDEERERQRRDEREMEEEVERERTTRDCEREAREKEQEKEKEKERQAELEAERQRELDLAREKVLEREEGRARRRERESGLPRLSILRGASLTPPDTVPPTPLSPLKEGKRCSVYETDLFVDLSRRVRAGVARRRVCSLRQRVRDQPVQAGFEDVYR